MIPRYSLYGNAATWKNDIVADTTGNWVKWIDIEQYIMYCNEHNYTPPVLESDCTGIAPLQPMYGLHEADDLDELDDTSDTELDLYDLMVNPSVTKEDE